MNNDQVAATFEQLANLLEFQGANSFRTRAYRNGARVIRDLPESIESILADPNQNLVDIPGIGKAVSEKCQVLVETGRLPQLDALLEEIPKTVLAILRVPGLGPKKAAVIYQELNVENLEQLRQACLAGEVGKLKGFGAKSEETILKGIDIAAAGEQRILWYEADLIAKSIEQHFSNCPTFQQLKLAGSYRRGKDTVGDLDVLIDSNHAKTVMDHFAKFGMISEVIARGDTKMSVRLQDDFQVDLRVVPAESFGAALQYFTGSKDHNVELRSRAKKLGLQLNEWGVFQGDGDDAPRVAGKTEQGVYEVLGLHLIEPELREARNELQWSDEKRLPHLIQLPDIHGDLHSHTTATDGKGTLEEMVNAARNQGWKYLAVTDHSKRVSMANGLDGERLLHQWQEVDELNHRLDGEFTVLKGIECDILEQGGMDLSDEILAQADWVLASVHYGQRQPQQQITDRILGALKNEHVSAIAHPTGRLLNRREPYQVDMEAVFQAALEQGKFLELNANPKRLDLHDVHCAKAKRMGIPIVISTDAHSTAGFKSMRYGVQQARRGGLAASDVINTRDFREFVNHH